MDDADIATRTTAKLNAASLADHRARMDNAGPGAKTCEDCGDEIPAKRRALVRGATRCVACQLEAEGGN
ncbi:MAG: TraR/DksA C4-type zinc finger protein [Thermodesulfobacteriota bacterium]